MDLRERCEKAINKYTEDVVDDDDPFRVESLPNGAFRCYWGKWTITLSRHLQAMEIFDGDKMVFKTRPVKTPPKQLTRADYESKWHIDWETVFGSCVLCLFGCVFIGILLLFLFGGGGKNNGGKSMAIVKAQSFVENAMVSPSSADFPLLDQPVVNNFGNKWTVKGYVDGQNVYGATIRNNYVCEMEYVGNDKWECVKLDMY